jgi:GWxTD domain-containing protein
MVTIHRSLLLALALVCASSAVAQAPKQNPLDFGKGPMQWLMTKEELRAWRDVKNEQQAKDFIDLFWVRRDPTPNTLANENKLEIEERVREADKRFMEGRKRGALTERGRVLITLGYPKYFGAEADKRTSQYMTGGGSATSGSVEGNVQAFDPTGGRAQAAREVWEYDYAVAQKYKLPKIEVVFISNQTIDGSYRRDTQRLDFTTALPNAVTYLIRNPELTKVPDWAKPYENPSATAAASVKQATVVRAPAKPAGADRLTLVDDAFMIDAQSGSDPFASLTSKDRFKKDGEMGWAAEYCTGTDDANLEAVKVGMKISGLVKGERINFNAPPDDLVPDSIKSSPGCYVVRGGIPLSEMDPGTYTLTISIARAVGEGSYNLTREFQVE